MVILIPIGNARGAAFPGCPQRLTPQAQPTAPDEPPAPAASQGRLRTRTFDIAHGPGRGCVVVVRRGSDARGVLAESPDRAASEDDQPGHDVDHPGPLDPAAE